jgi:hypothetical protein
MAVNNRHIAADSSPHHYGRGWREKVDLSVLDDETLDMEVRARSAVDILTHRQCVFAHPGIPALIGQLYSASSRKDWEAFDYELGRLYSIADQERVWLG